MVRGNERGNMSEILSNGGGNRVYNWGDIRRDIEDETPKEDDFTDVYSPDEITADKVQVQRIKDRLGIKPEQGISDSRVQEYAIAEDIGEMDWFGEDKRRDEIFVDGKGQNAVVFLSSEYDDFKNHIDAVCVICNADSGFEPVPFALDMTYNKNAEQLDKKMAWRHPFKSVDMPGLATAKYFEDDKSFGDKPLVEKGRIAVMPRFVVGFSPELSTEITELRMTSDGWGTLRREELSAKAKWCILIELKAQSEQVVKALEKRQGESALLDAAYQQAKALDRYFDGAIKAAKDMDKEHPEWEKYARKDEVVNEILSRKII